MPNPLPGFTTEVLATELDRLAPSLPLTPDDVAFIFRRTRGQLADDRAAGRPPPFVKLGGSIRYTVGDVREYINNSRFNNTTQANNAKKRRASGGVLALASSFGDFLTGPASALWPFTFIGPDEHPADFFAALGTAAEDDRREVLTRAEYMTELARSVAQRAAREEGEETQARLLKAPRPRFSRRNP